MKTISTLFIAFTLATTNVFASSVWDGKSISEFTQGDGSQESPFQIGNANQLAFMAYVVNAGTGGYDTAYYKLTTDVDIDNLPWFCIGTLTNSFKGNFDGDNHQISNINIADSSSLAHSLGLFGFADGATIKNITASGVISTQRGNSITAYCGGICGYARNSSIYNCHNLCVINVIGTNDSQFTIDDNTYVGGICGYSINSNIAFCHNKGILSTSSNTVGTNEASLYIGGICGQSNSSLIRCCYNIDTVSVSSKQTNEYINHYNKAYHYIGGICGYASSQNSINSCYNVGVINNVFTSAYAGNDMPSIKYAGGICGFMDQSSTIKNSSFSDDCGGSNVYGGARTSADIMQASAFVTTLNQEFPNTFVSSYSEKYPVFNRIYEIKIGVAEGNGSVTNTPDFFYGKEITMEAVAGTGYHFSKWDDGNTDNPRKFTVSSDKSFNAIFEINHYTITGKTVPASFGSVSGTLTYKHGDTATIEGAPAIGYKFTYWNDSVPTNPISFIMTGDTTLVAHFSKLCKVNTLVNDSSKGYISTKGIDKYGYCDTATNITAEAIAKPGFKFMRWENGDTIAKRTINVLSDTTMTAIFAKCHKVTTLTDNTWGFVTGDGIYEHDSTALLMAVSTQTANSPVFIKWNDGNRDNPRRIKVSRDTVFAAIFSLYDTVYVHDTTIIHDTIYLQSSINGNEAIAIDIYPNPTSSFVNVSATSSTFSYILTDSKGVMLKRDDDGMSFNIDMTEYSDGIYFITTSDGVTHKIIKQ